MCLRSLVSTVSFKRGLRDSSTIVGDETIHRVLLTPIVMTVMALGAAGCGPGQDQIPMRIGVSPTPPTLGTARVFVQLPDSVAPSSVQMVGRRPAGDSVTVEASPDGARGYAVPDFPFDEVGHWRIVVRARVGAVTLADSTRVHVIGGATTNPD